MDRTWMPAVAGILGIITGGLTLLGAIIVGVGVGVFYSSAYNVFGNQDVPTIVWVVLFLPIIIIGVVAIAGGVYSLRRKIWGLALAGSICSVLTIWAWPLGVASLVLVALSKSEFDHIHSLPLVDYLPPPSPPPPRSSLTPPPPPVSDSTKRPPT